MVTAVSISIYSTVTSLHKLQLLQVLIHCDAKPSFFQNAVWMTFWAFTMDGKKDGNGKTRKAQVSGMTVVTCVTGSSCSIAACVPFYPLTLTKRNRRDRLKRNCGERFHRRSHPTYAISRSPAQKVKGSEGGLVRKPFIHHFDLALSWWYEMPPN